MSCPRPKTARSDAKAVAELAEPLRSRIWTAMQDAPSKGLVLVSGYRDPGRQWDLRHERCRGRECDSGCKGYPVTAVPARLVNGVWVGGSRHQHRQAADMGGRDLTWLINNRHRYGIGLTVKSENWHFEASGTDSRTRKKIGAPTVRIIPFGGAAPKPVPPVKKDDFLMALTEAEQRELLTHVRGLAQNTPRKDFVLRDRRDDRVWVFTSGGRYWIRNMDALSLMIWAGKIAGFGPGGIPNADNPAQIDGVPEIATPENVMAYELAHPIPE